MHANFFFALPLIASASAVIVHSYVPWSQAAKLQITSRAVPANATVPNANATLASPASALAASRELANGLGLNVMIQQGELAATTDLLAMAQAKAAVDPKVFSVGKVCLDRPTMNDCEY